MTASIRLATTYSVLVVLASTSCTEPSSRPAAFVAPGDTPAVAVPHKSERTVAITIDDLPFISTHIDLATRQAITDGLVRSLTAARVPAIGFVNENKLARSGPVDAARVALLDQWARAGLDLGNHTYSHRSLHTIPLAAYEADILRGERETKKVLAAHGRVPSWFRHPFLHAGRDTSTQRMLSSFLADHGYRIAPVTVDNNDFVFARAYDLALDRNDSAAAKRIADDYIVYMDTVFGFYEQQSMMLLGYEVPQTVLIHANLLNATHMDRLLAMMRRRGYTFISLDQAVRDPAYRHRSGYTGPSGISWLQRWAMAENRPPAFYRGEPVVPRYVTEAAR
jgi:peptidoglycan/xylan/chitin deacetylase (PgdA/CDA1 family)